MRLDYTHISPFLIFLNILSAPFFAVFRNSKIVAKNIFVTISVTSFILTIYNLYCIIHNGPVVYSFGGWDHDVGIAFRTNSLSALMLVILSTGFVISSFGIRQNRILSGAAATYSCLLFAALAGCCVTADLFNTYVFIELSSIACYVLITMNTNNNRASYKVSFDYLIIASFAGILVLIGIFLIYAATGSLSMMVISEFLKDTTRFDLKTLKLLKCGYIFITTGFLVKTGFYPLYTWIIKTYTTSLSSVSSMLASTVGKVFVFMIYKNNLLFKTSPILYSTVENVGSFLCIFAICGMIVMGISNIGEGNLKKELSVSSMIQVCYFVMSAFVFNDYVISGLMLQMLVHSLCSATLFLILDESFYTIDPNYTPETTREIPKYLITRSTMTKFAFIILILNLVAFPTTSGFVGKWMLFRGFLDREEFIKFTALIVAGGIGLIYSWRIIERIVFFEHNHHELTETNTKQSFVIKVISLLAVILTFTCGIFIFKKPFEAIRLEHDGYFNER